MSLVRTIFHWILVVFFAMLAVIGFAGRDIPFGILNVTLVILSLPFGALANLTGPRRVTKWIATFVLMGLCIATLPH